MFMSKLSKSSATLHPFVHKDTHPSIPFVSKVKTIDGPEVYKKSKTPDTLVASKNGFPEEWIK
jgi:hypothetical protein